MCDVFEDHPAIDAERAKLWPLIRATPFLDWQLLTKRSDRVSRYSLPTGTVVIQCVDWCQHRKRRLRISRRSIRNIPAAVRFISYEPALVHLTNSIGRHRLVIYGGESGPHFRDHDTVWAERMAKKCAAARVAFFTSRMPHVSPAAARRWEAGLSMASNSTNCRTLGPICA